MVSFKQNSITPQSLMIDVAGFDMGYKKLKQFCKEAGKKYNYHEFNILDDEKRNAYVLKSKKSKFFRPVFDLSQ